MERAFIFPVFSKRSLVTLGVAMVFATPLFATAVQAQPAQREFSMVSANSPLYQNLQEIRRVGWTGIGADAPLRSTPDVAAKPTQLALTRYELALETAKAIFTIQARQRANVGWSAQVEPQSLRALRALCIALKSELLRLDVKVDEAIILLDQLAKNRPAVVAVTALDKNAPKKPFQLLPSNASSHSSQKEKLRLPISALESGEISLPLSQRLRVYGALSSLAREKNDVLQNYSARSENVGVEIGTSYNLSDRLRARAGMEQSSPDDFFIGDKNFADAARNTDRSISGGLDFALMSGVLLSGSVARVSGLDWDAIPGGDTNAMRYEGAIGLSGWQNRVALSANLARLVPEDSPAFGSTAAQLNLGVEVTRQIQLKLLFRQMFDTPQNPGSTRQISGGININF